MDREKRLREILIAELYGREDIKDLDEHIDKLLIQILSLFPPTLGREEIIKAIAIEFANALADKVERVR